MANKLDMTLDALIKTSRSKPAVKKAAKPGGGGKAGGAAGKQQKPQQKAQQKAQQKGGGASKQQQQQQGKKPQQRPGIKAAGGKQIKPSLQVKGGVSKASGGKVGMFTVSGV